MAERRDIFQALKRGDLVLHYQPIVKPNREAVSVEALLRGRHGDRRDLNITALTKDAEDTSKIFELDSWVFQRACRDAATWQRELPELGINVNVSAREFQNEDFLPMLEDVMRKSGLSPAKVDLEITETASIHDPGNARDVVTELQQRGHQIWLDDFGTGHSSLEWLKWFRAAGVKIASGFVKDVTTDLRGRAIVSAVTAMARDLGIAVVAEGVENQDQLAILTGYGVGLFQGFLFYQPLSLEELLKTLTNERSIQ